MLNILVVDAQPAIALPMIDMLRDLGHRTEVQNGGLGAITAVTAKRRANRPYQLVIANFEMADVDPVEFLHALRQHQETVPVCFYAHTHTLPREAFSAVEKLGARFASLPIDRHRMEAMVGSILGLDRRTSESPADSPFFGTGRVVRRSSSITDSVPRSVVTSAPPPLPIAETPAAPAPNPAGTARRPSAESAPTLTPFPDDDAPQSPVLRGTAQFSNQARYQRTPLPGSVTGPVIGDPLVHQPHAVSPTERIRRSITSQGQAPVAGPQPGTESRQPGTGSISSTTSRIRRTVTGRVVNPTTATGQAKVTICKSCGKQFYAELRAVGYTLPCLYCGQINRIDPA